nr:immunoglobulin light chain junction region [Macaca mulatta]
DYYCHVYDSNTNVLF